MPNFLVVGAARSATTSLHYYLQQHPKITMSTVKEPNFFAFDHGTEPPRPLIHPGSDIVTKSVPDRAAYERLFAAAQPGDAVGEASPLYLYVPEAPEQIQRVLGAPRLVAVLRNPIDRAYSHFLHIRRDAADAAVESFRRACEQEMAGGREPGRYGEGMHVLRMGLYDVQIRRYLDRFGRDPLLVLAYDDVVGQPLRELHRICDHVGVERFAFDTDTQYNRSGVTRSRVGARVTGVMRSLQPKAKAVLPASVAGALGRVRATFDRPDEAPPLPGDLRATLAEWFAPSVAWLEQERFVPPGQWADFS